MKITKILNEGLMKVPKSTLDDVMGLVCSDVFSRLFFAIEGREDELETKSILTKIMKQYTKKYGRFDLHDDHSPDMFTHQKVYMRMKEVDPNYIKNPSDKSRTYAIQVAIGHSYTEMASAAYYPKHQGTPGRIAIRLPTVAFVLNHLTGPEFLETLFDRLHGVVEHELMHAVEDMGLKSLTKGISFYRKDGSLDMEKYFGSEIEFGPQVVTAYYDFIAMVKDHTKYGHEIDQTKEREMMWKFLSPTAASVKLQDGSKWDFTNAFFDSLYRNDQKQWKKAVKYFYGLFQTR